MLLKTSLGAPKFLDQHCQRRGRGAIGAEALQRVRQPGREIPKVTLFNVVDAGAALASPFESVLFRC
jgi:hypothetical protein